MNLREQFRAVMNYQPFDRLPCWYFGLWVETLERWKKESGIEDFNTLLAATGMDPDWEGDMWSNHSLAWLYPIGDGLEEVLEETETTRTVRSPIGEISKISKTNTSIPETLEYALKPSRESWEHFKTFFDPSDPRRRAEDWESKAETLEQRSHVATFLLGSLYGNPRGWMGVEELSYIAFDDPVLFEEILDHLTNFYIETLRPILTRVHFDIAYIFEDCCYRNGPLLSPNTFNKYYVTYYRRLTQFARDMGVEMVLFDSDGKVDDIVQCCLDSGVDILFPIEVGTWNADPRKFRKQYGKQLRMMGGVNKHVIPLGEAAIRTELEPLRPLVEEGGFIPIPDHRIPPDCSWDQYKTYVRVFRETFG